MYEEITLRIDDSVTLRPITHSDAEAIFHTIDTQREYLGRWLPFVSFTREVADSRAFLSSTLDLPEERREMTFAIMVDGQFGGLIGFKDTDRGNLRTEIGYWLAEQYQGRGIVTSAVKALCGYAFGKMGMNRIQIKCAVGNTKSSNIPRRLGFTYEGTEREGERTADGRFYDIEVYSKLAGD